MHDLEVGIAPKLLFRYLIDNALSDQAGLSDNELVAFLMTAQGFTDAEIARVLEKTHVRHGRPTMTPSNASRLKLSAFRKVRAVSGLNDIPFSSEENTMPRGVYDRSKSKPRPSRNGRTAPAVEVTPSADPVWPATPWGQPYEISASDILLDVFCDEAIQAAAAAPADKAVVFPFADDGSASSAAQALRERFSQRGDDVARAWFRRNPPRVIVMRGPNWK